ncbi:MAG: restriction endonuclease [Mycobacteriales bacterium]
MARRGNKSSFGDQVLIYLIGTVAVLAGIWYVLVHYWVWLVVFGGLLLVGGLAKLVTKLWAEANALPGDTDIEWGLESTTRAVSVYDLDELTGTEFERWVVGLFQRDGHEAHPVGGAGDGGVDIVATVNGRRLAVQCKRYSPDRKLPPKVVRELLGSAALIRADGSVLVTTSGLTTQATRHAIDAGVVVVDRNVLARWVAGQPLTLPAHLR